MNGLPRREFHDITARPDNAIGHAEAHELAEAIVPLEAKAIAALMAIAVLNALRLILT